MRGLLTEFPGSRPSCQVLSYYAGRLVGDSAAHRDSSSGRAGLRGTEASKLSLFSLVWLYLPLPPLIVPGGFAERRQAGNFRPPKRFFLSHLTTHLLSSHHTRLHAWWFLHHED